MKIIIILNPLDWTKREEINVDIKEGMTYADIIPPQYHSNHIITSSLYGTIKPENLFDIVNPDDEILIKPEVKDPVSIFVITLAALKAISITGVIAYAISGVVAAGVLVGLYMISRPRTPKQGGGGDDVSNTYGWDGVSTSSDPENPIPIVYGKQRLGGNIIDYYVETTNNIDYMYLLLALGEGEFQSIAGATTDSDNVSLSSIGDKILLENNPITNYKDVNIYTRMGSDEQAVIAGFGNIHNYYSLGNEYRLVIEGKDDAVHTTWRNYTTYNSDVEELVLHFSCPSGLYKVDDEGDIKGQEITVVIKYRMVEPVLDSKWKSVSISYKQKIMSTFRFQKKISNLTAGKYEISVGKTAGVQKTTNSVETYLSAVDEVKYNTLTYPNVALLGIKAKASDQLSGTFPLVSVLCEGRKVKIWNGSTDSVEYSQNPIWCVRDFVENDRFGCGGFVVPYNEDTLNLLLDEANYCDELIGDSGEQVPRFTMNFVCDVAYKALDMIAQMTSSFRAFAFWSSGRIMVKVERQGLPVQMFAMGNIIKGTFSESFISRRERYNCIELEFNNEDIDYKRDIISLINEDDLMENRPLYKKTIFMPAITREIQARAVAAWILKVCQLVRNITFKAGIDAICCQPMDIILFAHDVPVWGVSSGRVERAFSNKIVLRNQVVLESGITYYIKVKLSNDQIIDKRITTPAGAYVAGSVITVESVWGDDMLPNDYDVYSIGQQNIEAKPFRILELKHTAENEVEISAIEYYDELYDDTDLILNPINYSDLPDWKRKPPYVTNLILRNVPQKEATIVVQYDIPQTLDYDETGIVPTNFGLWHHAEIWVSDDGGQRYVKHGDTSENTYFIKDLIAGHEYYVKVISVSRFGIKTDFTESPTGSITVKLEVAPRDIKGLELWGQGNDNIWQGKHAKFRWKEYSSSGREQFLGMNNNELEAGAGAKDDYFLDYKVEILHGGVSKRVEYLQDAEYTYTYEKNAEDGGESGAVREFTIRVWARDKYNQISEHAAELTVNNPQCASVQNFFSQTAIRSIFLRWNPNSEKDLAGYLIKRSYTSNFDWNDGTLIYDGTGSAFTDKADDDDPIGTEYYYKIAAYDLFGKDSLNPSSAIQAIAGYIAPHDIDDFALDASKLFFKIPVLEGEVWQDETPHSGFVAWNEHNLYYNGCRYKIAAGETNLRYIYWIYSEPTSGAEYTESEYYASDVHPEDLTGGLTDDDFIVCVNNDGWHDAAWNAIANQVIGSAYIMDAAITNAKIGLLAVDTANIRDAAITDAKIDSLQANKVVVGENASGYTTLDEWAHSEDSTMIDGGRIYTESITISKCGFGVVISFIDNDIPTSINEGDIWYQPSTGLMYRAATPMSNEIKAGEWEYYIDAAAAVNSAETLIQPGKIYIAGSGSDETTLADWSHGSDATFIDGGRIYTNSVKLNTLVAGARGISTAGFLFSFDVGDDIVWWTEGFIYYWDDNNHYHVKSIYGSDSVGAQLTSGESLFIYWIIGESVLSWTEDYNEAVGDDRHLIAIYNGADDITTTTNAQTIIDGNRIITGSIDADKLNVNELSAISSDLGSILSGSILFDVIGGSGDLNRIRIDENGIYVSHDNGATWKRFLAIDEDGKLVLFFDYFDDAVDGIFAKPFPEYVSLYSVEESGNNGYVINYSGWTKFDTENEFVDISLTVGADEFGASGSFAEGSWYLYIEKDGASLLINSGNYSFVGGTSEQVLSNFRYHVEDYVAPNDLYRIYAYIQDLLQIDVQLSLSVSQIKDDYIENQTIINESQTWVESPTYKLTNKKEMAVISIININDYDDYITLKYKLYDDEDNEIREVDFGSKKYGHSCLMRYSIPIYPDIEIGSSYYIKVYLSVADLQVSFGHINLKTGKIFAT